MDSSSAAAEMVTLCAAAGYVVHFFPTGQGNVIGNPIVPVIKLTANPRTVRTMSEHIDVDCSGLLHEKNSRSDRRRADRSACCAPQRPADRGRGARPPRVRADAALRIGLKVSVCEWRRRCRRAASSEFDVPRHASQTVLDVVTHIQRTLRSDARLPLRLPRRHVRLVRDDGERQAALDLPHARRQGGAQTRRLEIGPLNNLPVVRTSSPTCAVLRQVGARARGSSAAARTRAGRLSRVNARIARAPATPTRRSNASAAACATARATSSRGIPTTSGRRRSTARGRSSTTCATTAQARAPARGGGRCRLPRLPHADELHRALPEAALADGEHRGTEARER